MELFYRILKTLIFINIFEGYTVKCNCEYKPCNGVPHTMCIYPKTLDKSVASCSGHDAKAGLTDAGRRAILHKHNELRQRIAQGKVLPQPPAANMMKLTWDAEVEAIAQRYINKCDNMGHDNCRDLKDGTLVGQNSASNMLNEGGNRTIVMEKMVQMWYDEVKKFNTLWEIDSFTDSNYMGVGHYTQLVWAETTRLGCGYREDTKQYDFQKVVMSCNYAVTGRTTGVPMYIRGKACSKCPEKTHCSKKYPGLCTGEDENKGEIENGKKGGQRSDLVQNAPGVKFIIIVIVTLYIWASEI